MKELAMLAAGTIASDIAAPPTRVARFRKWTTGSRKAREKRRQARRAQQRNRK